MAHVIWPASYRWHVQAHLPFDHMPAIPHATLPRRKAAAANITRFTNILSTISTSGSTCTIDSSQPPCDLWPAKLPAALLQRQDSAARIIGITSTMSTTCTTGTTCSSDTHPCTGIPAGLLVADRGISSYAYVFTTFLATSRRYAFRSAFQTPLLSVIESALKYVHHGKESS